LAAGLLAAMLLTGWIASCQPFAGPQPPRRYLAITHPALNRVTFFDLDAEKVVGVLPAQKLPHDMLLSPDGRSMLVVNSGAQCVTRYHLDAPELWREGRAFMSRDTMRARPARGSLSGMGVGADRAGHLQRDSSGHPAVPVAGHGAGSAPHAAGDTTPTAGGLVYLNREAVHGLPPEVAEFHLTDPAFPEVARQPHARAGAERHRACFDCHERSVGAKPFGVHYTEDRQGIYIVHLESRSIAVLDAATLAIRRQVPIDLPPTLSPVELWVRPGTNEAFVSCRDEIGQSRRGLIVVLDLVSGATLATIPAGIYPWHLVPDPTGTRLYVNNFQSSRISVVDVAGRRIVDSLVVQNGPSMMQFSVDGRRLFVSCFYTDKVLVVDPATRRVEREIPVGGNPTSLLASPDGRTLLVLCGGESTLEQVELATFEVIRRHPLLFGAYAFQLVNRDRTGRSAAAVPLLSNHSNRGVGR
jgi:YVTN family beta-propeller protein